MMGETRLGARERAVQREPSPIRRWLKILGPGLITGASDDDPSGIGTYAVAGASLGLATLWTALATFPLMAALQFISSKVALVTGSGLAHVLRRHYPRSVMYPAVSALFIANTINAGADIGAIAAAVHLLVPVPAITLIVPIALVILAVQIWGSYRLITNTFKWLTLALFAYVGSAVLAHPDVRQVLRATFIPTVRFDMAFLSTLVGILGTTISPYLWFWQAAQETEEKVASGHTRLWQRRGTTDTELRYAAWDTNVGTLLSNLVMYFIILGTAATLFKGGKTDIQSAADAAEALRPLAGDWAATLFALGLIGSGFLAVPILTGSAAYALAEIFGWKAGLDRRPEHAVEFYAAIAASTLVGMQINFMTVDTMRALFWSAVINGFLAPPLLFLLLRIAANRAVMGDRVNGPVVSFVGWMAFFVMSAAAIALVLTWAMS